MITSVEGIITHSGEMYAVSTSVRIGDKAFIRFVHFRRREERIGDLRMQEES